jgi:hypothetical protein
MNIKKLTLKTKKNDNGESLNVRIPGVAGLLWFIFFAISILLIGLLDYLEADNTWIVGEMIVVNLIAVYLLFALKIADQWEKAVILRLGRFVGLRGPGLFWIVPIIDKIPVWIDHRVMVTSFSAEKTLTKDTVPVSGSHWADGLGGYSHRSSDDGCRASKDYR